jgi:ankyrin repeat protein
MSEYNSLQRTVQRRLRNQDYNDLLAAIESEDVAQVRRILHQTNRRSPTRKINVNFVPKEHYIDFLSGQRFEPGPNLLLFTLSLEDTSNLIKLQIAKLLVDAGANIFVTDEDVGVIISIVRFGIPDSNRVKLLKYFLDLGADPNYDSPIIQAINHNYLDSTESTELMIQLLINYGADINALHKDCPALYYASIRGYTTIVKLLLNNGANPFYIDKCNVEHPWEHNLPAHKKVEIEDLINKAKKKLLGEFRYKQYIKKKIPIHLYKSGIPREIVENIGKYYFQNLQSLKISQLRRVYQKVYGKKCPAKTKREILKLLHRK